MLPLSRFFEDGLGTRWTSHCWSLWAQGVCLLSHLRKIGITTFLLATEDGAITVSYIESKQSDRPPGVHSHTQRLDECMVLAMIALESM